MLKKHKLNDFLSNFPLYKEFKVVENYVRTCEGYTDPTYFHGETFEYFCEEENEIKTFELQLPEQSKDFWGGKIASIIPNEVFNEKDLLDYTHNFVGECKSCKKYHIHFLLHTWSDKTIPKNEDHIIRINPETNKEISIDEFNPDRANIFIEKVGIKPEKKIEVDKFITQHFDRESNNWYYKAIKSFKDNLGIGAFAYFRRIIEKELLKIVEDISKLESSDKKIKQLLKEYKASNKVYSIYENIFSLLPKSLQSLGFNPIQTLYQQTSEGLHSLTENECLERAENINIVLKFVIKKLNEEQSEILEIREALKKLNKK